MYHEGQGARQDHRNEASENYGLGSLPKQRNRHGVVWQILYKAFHPRADALLQMPRLRAPSKDMHKTIHMHKEEKKNKTSKLNSDAQTAEINTQHEHELSRKKRINKGKN